MSLIDEIEHYWNLRSNGFSSAVCEELKADGDAIADRLMSILELPPGSNVLDLGCGPGLFSILLSRNGMNVTGIDYSQGMIDKAKANTESNGLNVDYIKMDAQNLEYADCTFDAVVSRNLLWNLEHPESCYSEMFRVLKPGGKAFIMDGNFYLDRSRSTMSNESGNNLHDRHNTDGVDFSIMTRIADSLPLSSVVRPAWDVDLLCKMNCKGIRIMLPERCKGKYATVSMFTVLVTKGGDL